MAGGDLNVTGKTVASGETHGVYDYTAPFLDVAEIFAKAEYECLSENEDFKKLVEEAENYSVEEISTKADLIFATHVKTTGSFAVKAEEKKSKVVGFNFNKKESKKTFVDCVMEYDDGEGNIIVYNNVEVYLQGTSSLQYPVKNYKIKTYVDEDKSSKFKFTPPNKADDWVPDSTYTLKCDYMEQSHKNNTPTAKFYETVIDALGGESPAKKDGYHDAIDGFPCVVYYNEGGTNGQNILVGSFMFNLDKEAKELCDKINKIFPLLAYYYLKAEKQIK